MGTELGVGMEEGEREGRLEELAQAIRGLYKRGETLRIPMTKLGRQAEVIRQDMADGAEGQGAVV